MSCPFNWHLSRSRAIAALSLALLVLSGCGSDPKDDLAGRTAEKLYAQAKEDMDSGSFASAIKSLERVEGLGAGTLLSQQAQLDLAYLYWKTQERAQGLATLDRFIKFNPSSPALDYALYLRGLMNFNEDLGLLGRLARQDVSERDQRASRDAYQSFKQLIEQFPTSPYVDDARVRMAFIVNTLAAYEVHVARYYYRRGAYVAAANRAQQAVTDYQQSPAVEEALHLMVLSYDRLKLEPLRDAAARVLASNFPGSRYLDAKSQEPGRPWWQFW